MTEQESMFTLFTLVGGPYDGQKIVRSRQAWRECLPCESPYFQNASAIAVYGSRDMPGFALNPMLYYWGTQQSHKTEPNDARQHQRQYAALILSKNEAVSSGISSVELTCILERNIQKDFKLGGNHE